MVMLGKITSSPDNVKKEIFQCDFFIKRRHSALGEKVKNEGPGKKFLAKKRSLKLAITKRV
jgi:hypothetical protein